MSNTFYYNACEMDTKLSPYADFEDVKDNVIHRGENDNNLVFHTTSSEKKLYAPSSIMNENVAINYRNIHNFIQVLKQSLIQHLLNMMIG